MWVWMGMGWDDSQISNLQTELKYLGSFKFYHVSTGLDPRLRSGSGGWVWFGGGVSTELKSSNIIEIS